MHTLDDLWNAITKLPSKDDIADKVEEKIGSKNDIADAVADKIHPPPDPTTILQTLADEITLLEETTAELKNSLSAGLPIQAIVTGDVSHPVAATISGPNNGSIAATVGGSINAGLEANIAATVSGSDKSPIRLELGINKLPRGKFKLSNLEVGFFLFSWKIWSLKLTGSAESIDPDS